MIQFVQSVNLQMTTMNFHLIKMINLHFIGLVIELFKLGRAVPRQVWLFFLYFQFITFAEAMLA